jgi:hypothetical protein
MVVIQPSSSILLSQHMSDDSAGLNVGDQVLAPCLQPLVSRCPIPVPQSNRQHKIRENLPCESCQLTFWVGVCLSEYGLLQTEVAYPTVKIIMDNNSGLLFYLTGRTGSCLED